MTRFLFQYEAFSFEALRAAGFANHGGADLGEVLAIANAIGSADRHGDGREGTVSQRASHISAKTFRNTRGSRGPGGLRLQSAVLGNQRCGTKG